MESFKSEPQFSPFSPRKPSLFLFFARSCSITLYRNQPIKIELLSYYLTIMVRYRNLVRQIGPSESSGEFRVGLDGTNPLISCWRPIFIMGYSITNKNRKCIFPKYWRYLVNFAVFWGTKTAKKRANFRWLHLCFFQFNSIVFFTGWSLHKCISLDLTQHT